MSNNIESPSKVETEDSNQSFEAIIAANKAKAEKQKKERDTANAQVLRTYNIKRKG